MTPSTMVTFINLPLEIRREIYQYLLLGSEVSERFEHDRNAVRSQGIVLQIPQISTGLFTVNKQISCEALQYFYQQNAFVAIKAPFGPAFRYCRFLFPCFSWLSWGQEEADLDNRMQCIEKVGLVINWASKLLSPRSVNDAEIAALREPQTLVFSIRYLPTAIRILNNEQYPWLPNKKIEMHLNFRLGSSFCKGYPKFADVIVSSLKNLKTHYIKDHEPYVWVSISGDIDKGRSDSLLTSKLPHHSRRDPILNCEWAIEMGDRESRKGNFTQAENYYDMIARFLDLWYYPRNHETHLMKQCRELKVQGHLKAASNCLKAKDYEWACVRAAMACETSHNIYEDEDIDDEWVRMNHQAGRILSEPGDYEREKNLRRALGVLDEAVFYAGDAGLRQDITATIETVETELRDLGVDKQVPAGLTDFILEHKPPQLLTFVPSAG